MIEKCRGVDKNISGYLNKYRLIVKEIDKICLDLHSLHSKHLQCKKGCDLCCMDYRIFPVEFYSILNQINKENTLIKPAKKKNNSSCIFLKDHSCSIYENRPVICRTHGLPLVYVNDDNEWEISNCELNFTMFDFEDFSTENTLPMDKFNSKLFVLNKEFIHDFSENLYKETDLIPLKKLVEHL